MNHPNVPSEYKVGMSLICNGKHCVIESICNEWTDDKMFSGDKFWPPSITVRFDDGMVSSTWDWENIKAA